MYMLTELKLHLLNGLKEYYCKQVVNIVAQKVCLKKSLEKDVLVYKIFLE